MLLHFIELTYRDFLPSPNIHKFKEEKFLRRSHAILGNIFAATWNSPKKKITSSINIHFPILSLTLSFYCYIEYNYCYIEYNSHLQANLSLQHLLCCSDHCGIITINRSFKLWTQRTHIMCTWNFYQWYSPQMIIFLLIVLTIKPYTCTYLNYIRDLRGPGKYSNMEFKEEINWSFSPCHLHIKYCKVI